MLTVAQKIEHLRKIGFTCDLTEVEKFYAGKQFNQQDANVQKLVQYSQNLWSEYSRILKDLTRANESEKARLLTRKEELINRAFPEHGLFANVCDEFYCTVGAVDFDQNNMSSINKNVKFGKYTLAELGNYALIGEDVRIGATLGTNVQPNQKVILGNDTWLCASTVIGAGAKIANGTVLGSGACVHPNQVTAQNSLTLGNPAKTKLIISDKYQSTKDNRTNRSQDEINRIVSHVRSLGLDVDDAFIGALNGEKYNCFSRRMAEITKLSHDLSYEFNHNNTTAERRREIIDMLFPIKGTNFQVGQGLFVDVLGLAKIGNNVKIGDNAYFAGNVTLGDNVRVGANFVCAGIGHELPGKLRHLRQFQGVHGEVCEVGKINVANNVKIGDNCTLAPGCILTQNLASNHYVVGQNKIFDKVAPEKLANDFLLTR